MVRILSNGDIVQDDDPRAKQGRSRPQENEHVQRRGFVQHAEGDGQPHYHMPQGSSLFDNLNQRLLDAGIPRWNAGPYPVEPIVSVGVLLLVLMFGLSGLLLGALLFLVCKWSQSGGNASTGERIRNSGGPAASSSPGSGQRGGGGGWSGTGGGGHRLGRS